MGFSFLADFLGHFADLGITIIMFLTTIANLKKKNPENGGQERKCDVLGRERSWQTGL